MNILNKKGDTIVEVMIAIVVLGAALGGAFAISNRSVRQTQANHERYQIQLWVNQQAEFLRSDYANHLKTGGTRATYSPGSDICVVANSADPQCDRSDFGGVKILVEPNTGPDGIVPATAIVSVADIKSYKITATWNSLATGNNSQLELRYDI